MHEQKVLLSSKGFCEIEQKVPIDSLRHGYASI